MIPIRRPKIKVEGYDPYGPLDFSALEEIDKAEASDPPDHVRPTFEETFEDDTPIEDIFQSNEAQARFRQAALSGQYDTLLAAGTISSSKTIGIAALICELCLEYPETLVLVVRYKLDSLVDNTIPDFLSVAPSSEYKMVGLDMRFHNRSVIQFRPSIEITDKNFMWLRGKKPDILFVDECDAQTREFISAGQSRVGVQRRRSRKNIPICPPLTLLACNPNISWPKDHYSKYTHRPETMKPDRFYFQKFSIKDNAKYITEAKIAQWKRVMTPPMYRRFVEGSWDAMSDLEQLFLFEDMDKCRPVIPPRLGPDGKPIPWKYYLGVDPARFGPDKCAFLVMHGPNLHRMDFHQETSITQVADHVKRLMAEFNITPNHVTIDVIGLGAGVADTLATDQIFINQHNGASAADPAAFYMVNPEDPNSRLHMDNAAFTFRNKRAQTHWEGMQMLRAGQIGGFDTLGWKDETNLDEVLRQDLASIHYGFAKGSKAIQIEDKEEIKKRLHRSPDFSDVFLLCLDAYLHDAKKPSMEVFSF